MVPTPPPLVSQLDPGFMEHKEFREFYRFCFKFNREDAQKKTIEKDMVRRRDPARPASRRSGLAPALPFLP